MEQKGKLFLRVEKTHIEEMMGLANHHLTTAIVVIASGENQ